MKQHLTELIEAALDTLAAEGKLDPALKPRIQIDRTRDSQHGDLACNTALTLAKAAGQQPRVLADLIVAALPPSPSVVKAEVAGPGFINFYLSEAGNAAVVERVLNLGDAYGHSDAGEGRKVLVEFVSANPTGPLHIGHGRGAAVGDSIARLLEATGWNVSREFYYNDAGAQIDNLARSVQARCRGLKPGDADWPEDSYHGEYIAEVAEDYMAGKHIDAADQHADGTGDIEDIDAIRRFAVACLRREQDLDLQAFGVRFDEFFLESSLYESGAVEATVKQLADNGHTFEQDEALWLRTTTFGDDKDRVMRKRDGGYTYFLPDVAYHRHKWQRGFGRAINEQGADHHGTVARVRAGLQALGEDIPEGWPEYVLHQMVTVMRDGREVKVAKRAGNYVTLRYLIDEAGCDATRYFLAARAPDAQLTFDMNLALSKTNDNPVYYIQYAHARTRSVQRKLEKESLAWDREAGLANLDRLAEDSEKAILRRLDRFPELVARAAERSEPHAVASYLRELAGDYHSWYNAHKIIADDADLRNARLALSEAVRQVIANGLWLLGVTAPEKM